MPQRTKSLQLYASLCLTKYHVCITKVIRFTTREYTYQTVQTRTTDRDRGSARCLCTVAPVATGVWVWMRMHTRHRGHGQGTGRGVVRCSKNSAALFFSGFKHKFAMISTPRMVLMENASDLRLKAPPHCEFRSEFFVVSTVPSRQVMRDVF